MSELHRVLFGGLSVFHIHTERVIGDKGYLQAYWPSCIVQATHIFDGLEAWPTHLMYLAGGHLQQFKPAKAFPELQEGRLLQLIEK